MINVLALRLTLRAAVLATLFAGNAVGQELVIQLSDAPVAVSGPTVRVGDIAQVICNDRSLKKQIENLDLDSGQRRSHHFDVHVTMKTRVAITNRPVPRGQTITADLIRVVTRPIVNRTPVANPNDLIGKVANQSIDRDEILLASHVVKPDRRRYPVVRRNDLIDVVVRIGGADVRLKNARAMESGRIGDTIEVLNTRTNKRLSASIVSKNIAAIDLGVTRR